MATKPIANITCNPAAGHPVQIIAPESTPAKITITSKALCSRPAHTAARTNSPSRVLRARQNTIANPTNTAPRTRPKNIPPASSVRPYTAMSVPGITSNNIAGPKHTAAEMVTSILVRLFVLISLGGYTLAMALHRHIPISAARSALRPSSHPSPPSSAQSAAACHATTAWV